MSLKTRSLRSQSALKTLTEVPQGDPPSPQLFKMFINTYNDLVNRQLDKVLELLFFNYVIGFSPTLRDLHTFLNDSAIWADEFGMTWEVLKSSGLSITWKLRWIRLNYQSRWYARRLLDSREWEWFFGVSCGRAMRMASRSYAIHTKTHKHEISGLLKRACTLLVIEKVEHDAATNECGAERPLYSGGSPRVWFEN